MLFFSFLYHPKRTPEKNIYMIKQPEYVRSIKMWKYSFSINKILFNMIEHGVCIKIHENML